MIQIIDMNHFEELKKSGVGFIAITDKNLAKNCVHHVTCHEVNGRYFNQKVVVNKGKNGSYLYTNDANEALNTLDKMTKCQKCF
ncbi:hypothetical protein JOC95_002012 [Bacillus tianshenii]|uniref:Uncharacterized protein n=1 Tax=Sutcliffiella tianshenii TaxID=1463404 RepID=A0ABS2NZM9_9BACI|nr:hypothetical protein [Bacillus tianshenii]MBM7620159.1 hypothetical protein [Bacillus tianshenii]